MSRHHRLGVPLTAGAVVVVTGPVAHHLEHVLRARLGDRFVGVGLAGDAFEVEVVALGPLSVAVGAAVELGAEPTAALEVWLPLLKGGKTDDLVRQLTELGATRIVPWCGERSVARLEGRKAGERVARWRAIAAEATGQCGRVAVPEVTDVAALPPSGPGVFFWEAAREPARAVLARLAVGGSRAVLVGPEGGVSGAEAEALVARGWQPAWLGPRILRAETAVVAAATLALHALGEGGY